MGPGQCGLLIILQSGCRGWGLRAVLIRSFCYLCKHFYPAFWVGLRRHSGEHMPLSPARPSQMTIIILERNTTRRKTYWLQSRAICVALHRSVGLRKSRLTASDSMNPPTDPKPLNPKQKALNITLTLKAAKALNRKLSTLNPIPLFLNPELRPIS